MKKDNKAIQQRIDDLQQQLDESAIADPEGTDVQRAWHYLKQHAKTKPNERYLFVYAALKQVRPLLDKFLEEHPASPKGKDPYIYFFRFYQALNQRADALLQALERINHCKTEQAKRAAEIVTLESEISMLWGDYNANFSQDVLNRMPLKIEALAKKVLIHNAICDTQKKELASEQDKLVELSGIEKQLNQYEPLSTCLKTYFRVLEDVLPGLIMENDSVCSPSSYSRYSVLEWYVSQLNAEDVQVYLLNYRIILETQKALNRHLERARNDLEQLQPMPEEKAKEPDEGSLLVLLSPDEARDNTLGSPGIDEEDDERFEASSMSSNGTFTPNGRSSIWHHENGIEETPSKIVYAERASATPKFFPPQELRGRQRRALTLGELAH